MAHTLVKCHHVYHCSCPPVVEQRKLISAVAPDSLVLNILSLCYSLHLSHNNLLQRVQQGALTSSTRRIPAVFDGGEGIDIVITPKDAVFMNLIRD